MNFPMHWLQEAWLRFGAGGRFATEHRGRAGLTQTTRRARRLLCGRRRRPPLRALRAAAPLAGRSCGREARACARAAGRARTPRRAARPSVHDGRHHLRVEPRDARSERREGGHIYSPRHISPRAPPRRSPPLEQTVARAPFATTAHLEQRLERGAVEARREEKRRTTHRATRNDDGVTPSGCVMWSAARQHSRPSGAPAAKEDPRTPWRSSFEAL